MKINHFIKILLVFLSTQSLAEIKQITLVSEELEDITHKDGTGLYWEIFDVIFNDTNIKVNKLIKPYARGQLLVKEQKVDGLVGAYQDEFEKAIFPKQHFDQDSVLALYNKGKVKNWSGVKSLSGTVSWIRGYEYDQYIEGKKFKIKLLKNRKQAFQLLKSGRIDFFLDPYEDLENELEKQIANKSINKDDFEKGLAMTLKLYIAFLDNERGKEILEIYDRQLSKFIKNGKLRPLFEKWSIKYPF